MILGNINVILLDIPFHDGMAGTMRVRNLLLPLYENREISLSNLAMINNSEKYRIGESGSNIGIDYKFIGYSSFMNIGEIFRFYKEGSNFIKVNLNPGCKNIIYYYGYPDLKNIFFIIYAKYKKCKVIFDIVEDNRHANFFLGFAGKIRNRTSLFLLKMIPHFSDGVIVISSALENWLNSLYNNKIKVFNIPITVNLKNFEISEVREMQRKDIITIFYGGSFASKDGLEFLLMAFNQVCLKYDNLHLVLSGIGQSSDMEKIYEIVKQNNKITYVGFLSSLDYCNVLKSCDICCMTRNNSLYSNAGFPFKLGEFLAAGKAIIATNVGDVPKYLTNGKNALLVPPESSEAISEAMILYIENKDGLRQKLGIEAKKTAKEYFDSTVLSKKLLEIFKKI